MKRILSVLAMLLVFANISFANEYVDKDLFYNAQYCYLDDVQKYISRGANINAKDNKGHTPLTLARIENMQKNSKECRQVIDYLISLGAEGLSVIEILSEGLREVSSYCNLELVKEWIAKGADINAKDSNGYTAFNIAAYRSIVNPYNSENCRKVPYYLSSIGAVDVGYYTANYHGDQKYEKPLVFENRHLKITLNKYWLKGSSFGTLENKTEDPIYIYSYVHLVNGKKSSRVWGTKENPNGQGIVEPDSEIAWILHFVPEYKNKKSTIDDYPKVINNKVKFTSEYTLTYGYKGKTYEFKLPKFTQETNVTYQKD